MAPLQHQAVLADQGKGPLLHPKRGAFFYADFRPLRCAPKGCEDGQVRAHADCVIAPMPRGNHAPVKVQDTLELGPVECGNGAPVPGMRERRNDAQALFAFGAGCRVVLMVAISLRSSAISFSSSQMRTRTGSMSSPQGVP